MNNEKCTITFTLIYLDKEYPIQTYSNQYPNLMTLISHYLEINKFATCDGLGNCSSCMVEIAEKYSGNRTNTLSCDTPIDDELANTVITIGNY